MAAITAAMCKNKEKTSKTIGSGITTRNALMKVLRQVRVPLRVTSFVIGLLGCLTIALGLGSVILGSGDPADGPVEQVQSAQAEVSNSPNVALDTVSLSPQLTGFLGQYCRDCHSGEKLEGGLNLDVNAVTFGSESARRRWAYLYDRVTNGEMPPKSAEQPGAGTKQKFLHELGAMLTRADLTEREVVLRRLNRREYTNTVRDLFGIYVDVSRVLVDDSTETGFDNIGSKLSVSSQQMELYVEAADLVLNSLFGPEKAPRSINKTVNMATLKRAFGKSERKLSDGVVLFSGAKQLPLYDASAPTAGLYRYRVTIRAEQTDEPVVMRVYGGNTGRIAAHLVGFFEAQPDKLTTIEFTDRAREQWDTLGFGLVGGFPFWSVNADEYKGPGLFIGDVSIEGPVDEWSASRKRLLGDVDPSQGTIEDARAILAKTMSQAFRRPVGDEDIELYMTLPKQALDQGESFERALRLGLKNVLCAPEFLFLEERPAAGDTKQIDDHALACRLSYFFWSSLPDKALRDLADRRELKRPDVLRAQVERMLADPKSTRFVENFTGQWLRLRDIDFTVPDRRLYPEYNQLLRGAMLDESHAFFREILDHDLSVQNFIDSDFAMINQPLAEFYGIDGVKGLDIRRVPLSKDSVRGGVLTQASVLKVSADGTRTSPVLRGVWILNHLYGTPPPPPPPTVSTVEPDVRGASTIREELAKHRADQSCSRCHRKIDPPGFALESFDVLGAYRDWYRTRQGGKYFRRKTHSHTTQNVQYQQGPNVDASGELPDGRKFTDIKEYKQLLLEDETARSQALLGNALTRSSASHVDSDSAKQSFGDACPQAGAWEQVMPALECMVPTGFAQAKRAAPMRMIAINFSLSFHPPNLIPET